MKKISQSQLNFIGNKQNTEEQWKHSWDLFENFHNYLARKKLKPHTISKKTNSVILFFFKYIKPETDIEAINKVTPADIMTFLDREFYDLYQDFNFADKKFFLKAIYDFLEMLQKNEFYSESNLDELNQLRKNLKTREEGLKKDQKTTKPVLFLPAPEE